MRERFKAIVLRFMKVPPEPHVPAGSPGSERVFQAAPNYFKLKLFLWALSQVAGVVGIVMFLLFWHTTLDTKVPRNVNLVISLMEWVGIVSFVVQMPFTYMIVRLDYELRWYIVTDRSLRIRSGVWKVSESTLTFANIQQITVRQGPLQRLLGIYDLEVTTAGGGGSSGHHPHGKGESLHTGYFHGIDNAPEVRGMLLERLRRLRDTGLGDPDETSHEEPEALQSNTKLIEAARELLEETRAFRRVAG